jgi:hypothetical protein
MLVFLQILVFVFSCFRGELIVLGMISLKEHCVLRDPSAALRRTAAALAEAGRDFVIKEI